MKQEFIKLLNQYCDVKNDLMDYTLAFYDSMVYDIQGWEELLDDKRVSQKDLDMLKAQVEASKLILKGMANLKFRYS